MFTGPVGPVEVFFYWPEAVFGNFYWPGAIGSPLASSPEVLHFNWYFDIALYQTVTYIFSSCFLSVISSRNSIYYGRRMKVSLNWWPS